MSATRIKPPTSEEIARVDAWRAEQARHAEERDQLVRRYYCMAHGYSRSRVLYGPMPWGYGMGCKACRREWERQNGRPWESADAAREREAREHAAMVAEIEAMPPDVFWSEWVELRDLRRVTNGRYDHRMTPDEFGVNGFGSATDEGRRYSAMRDRVRRELAAFEEARSPSQDGTEAAR